jgi:hypothetical protein
LQGQRGRRRCGIGERDVIGIGGQACGSGVADGLALCDVTDPTESVELSFLPTPTGVHKVDLTVRADGQTFALLSTPYGEFFDTYMSAPEGATTFVSNLVSRDGAYQLDPGVSSRTLGQAIAGMRVFQIADIDDLAAGIRAAVGPVTLTVTAQTPSWGVVRVFRQNGGDEWQQVGAFTDAPHANDELPTPPGSWLVHKTEVLGDRAHSSWSPTASWRSTSATPRNRTGWAVAAPIRSRWPRRPRRLGSTRCDARRRPG